MKKEEVPYRNFPRSSSPSDVIEISDEDDDNDVQVVDSSNIDVVITDKRVGLKQQQPRVERTVQFAVEYYLGYYIFINSFPSSHQKHIFARDGLVNAAHSLNLLDVKQRLLTDISYADLLAPLVRDPLLIRLSLMMGTSSMGVSAPFD